jgi:DNA-directed RNA polymerase subunit H (RpoH/RPB5)
VVGGSNERGPRRPLRKSPRARRPSPLLSLSPPPSPRSRRKKTAAAAEPPAERPFVAHHLVPPHELLTADEGTKVLAELGVSLERMPKILVSDPGLRTDAAYRAAREAREPLHGRIVRIRRPSPTAGEAVAYRVIISSLGE